MRDFLNDLIHNAPKRTNPAHASLVMIIGIYVCYLGVKMVLNTQSGASSMPMHQSIILCVIMCIAGGIVVLYGLLLFYHSSKHRYYGGVSDTDAEKDASTVLSKDIKKDELTETSDDAFSNHTID